MNSRAAQSGFVRSLLSIALGLVVAAIVMRLCGYNPGEAYAALLQGASGLKPGAPVALTDLSLGGWHLSLYDLAQTLSHVTPLIFTGLSVTLGLRAGLFNIGAQGQMIAGAIAAATVGLWGNGTLSPLLHVPLTLCAGVVGGALWGMLAGFLKASRGVHEVISTIMLNYIALNISFYLINHSLLDNTPNNMTPQSPLLPNSSQLPALVSGANLSAGIFLALFCAVAVTFLIRKTSLGYEIRAVGLGAEAAKANGISVEGVTLKTMGLCGALAGLAGAIEVMGVQHRFVSGIASSYGFDGISVALLGGLSGIGVLLSGLFFGGLSNGASAMKLIADVPDSIAIVVQAVVIIFIGIRTKESPLRKIFTGLKQKEGNL